MNELEMFKTNKPDAEQLRGQYPELADLLSGTFADKPNVYELEQGTVVSWELLQGKTKNPTYGRIPQGHYEFPTEFTEEVTVLEGTLEAEVSGNRRVLGQHGKIVAPPNSLLKLDVQDEPVFYFCEYR